MERREQSIDLTSTPRVTYELGVNVTTPYIIRISGVRFGQLLREKFAVPERYLDKIGFEVSSGKSGRGDRCLAETDLRSSLLGNTLVVKLFMGQYWDYPFSPQHGILFRGRRFEATRQDITRTIFHESQHVKDSLGWIDSGQQSLQATEFLAAGLFLGIVGIFLETRNRRKASNVAIALSVLSMGNGVFNDLRSRFITEEWNSDERERVAREAEKLIPVKNWVDMVEFKPNKKG